MLFFVRSTCGSGNISRAQQWLVSHRRNNIVFGGVGVRVLRKDVEVERTMVFHHIFVSVPMTFGDYCSLLQFLLVSFYSVVVVAVAIFYKASFIRYCISWSWICLVPTCSYFHDVTVFSWGWSYVQFSSFGNDACEVFAQSQKCIADKFQHAQGEFLGGQKLILKIVTIIFQRSNWVRTVKEFKLPTPVFPVVGYRWSFNDRQNRF